MYKYIRIYIPTNMWINKTTEIRLNITIIKRTHPYITNIFSFGASLRKKLGPSSSVRSSSKKRRFFFFPDRFSPKVVFFFGGVWKPKRTTSLNSWDFCCCCCWVFYIGETTYWYILCFIRSFELHMFHFFHVEWYCLVKLMTTPSYYLRKLTWNLKNHPLSRETSSCKPRFLGSILLLATPDDCSWSFVGKLGMVLLWHVDRCTSHAPVANGQELCLQILR